MRCARTRMLCGSALVALLAVGCEDESSAPPPMLTASELAVVETPATDVAPGAPAETAEVLDSAYSGEAEAPELPTDVPLYAAATPISSMSSPTRGTIAHLRSADPVDRVSAWYGEELSARGWRLETQAGATNSRLVTALKDERKATVLITAGPDGTEIILTVLGIR